MNIQELKTKSSESLISQAEDLGIENANSRKQEILFSILKKLAEKGEEITGGGVHNFYKMALAF